MRKISLTLLLVVVFFLSAPAHAINWVTGNQATIAWDPVTKDEAGNDINPSIHRIEYECFLADLNKTNPMSVGRFSAVEVTFSLSQDGDYLFGCKSVKVQVSDNADLSESVVSWTDDPEMCADIDGDGTGDPFGIRYFATPLAPTKYRAVNGG